MRLPTLSLNELNPEQRKVADLILSSPRKIPIDKQGLIGPFGVWARAPQVGLETQALGAKVRFSTELAENVKEVAICTVGQFHRSKFEFAAHRKLAVTAGVDDSKLERLRSGDAPGFDGDENIAWRVACALLNDHRLPDDLYSEALTALGETPLIELVLTIGYYCLVSHTLNAFEIPLTDEMEDPFPGD